MMGRGLARKSWKLDLTVFDERVAGGVAGRILQWCKVAEQLLVEVKGVRQVDGVWTRGA